MEWSRKVVSNLKLRMSWGNIGNQNISAYAYIPGMESIRANWVVGDEKVTTLQKPKLVSNTFTWEKVSTLDFGVDLGLFNNRLNMVFDWYNRQTKGMLAPGMQLPGVLGGLRYRPPLSGFRLRQQRQTEGRYAARGGLYA